METHAVTERGSTGGRSRPGARTAAGVALAGLAATHAGPGITAIAPVRRRLFPRLAGFGLADHVALTFDDGPDPACVAARLARARPAAVRAPGLLRPLVLPRSVTACVSIPASGAPRRPRALPTGMMAKSRPYSKRAW